MINIIIVICITLFVISCVISYTIITIRHGNYTDIVLNNDTYKAAIKECNVLLGKISVLKSTADKASVSIESDKVNDSFKIEVARFIINQIKTL